MDLPGILASMKTSAMFTISSLLRDLVLILIIAKYASSASSTDDLRQRRTGESSYQTIVMGEQLMSQRNNLRGNPNNGYSVDIDIGTPKQKLNVLVDTGSSNFAIAAAHNPILRTYYKYNKSSTYSSLDRDIDVRYTVGHWRGVLGRDKVNLPAGPDVSFNANVANILESDDFFINGSYWQGILGLGYADIALPDSSITPFFESLVTQTDVPNIFTMQLCGIDDKLSESEGRLTIGGIDKELYEGKITYTPLRRKWFYEVVISDIKINNNSLGMDCKEYNNDKTFVDSGTTRLRLPTRVFDEVVSAVKREVSSNPLSRVPIPDNFWLGNATVCKDLYNSTELWDIFPSLTVALQGEMEGEEFELLIPSKQYLRLNDSGEDCYTFGITSSSTGTVLGVTLMEGYYIIFDRQRERIGFAASTCAKTQCLDGPACSLVAPAILGPYQADVVDCAFYRGAGSSHAMEVAGYILLALCLVCFLPVALMYLHLKLKQNCGSGDGYSRHHNDISSTELDDDP